MTKKRILIVDDEESILVVLKNSLKKLGPDYDVVAVSDGFAALGQLLVQPFDLIISDYNMTQMDGLELLEAIRYAQPEAQLIMITAYGSDALEAEAQQLQVYRYLTKPLKINDFRQLILEVFGQDKKRQPTIPILSGERYQQISHLLEQLRGQVGARCVFLTDTTGHLVARTGDTEKLSIENIASVLGGGIASLTEAGRMLDGDTEAINLAHREGKQEDLYALNIGRQFLLTLIINRGPYSSRLGSVWYPARQTALTLREELTQVEHASPDELFEEDLNEAFGSALDDLFNSDNL